MSARLTAGFFMSFTFDVRKDFKQAEKMLNGLRTVEVKKAANSALNKTITTVRKEAVPVLHAEIGKGTGITKSGLKKALILKRSTQRTLIAAIRVSGRPMPLIRFGARKSKEGVRHNAWGKRQTAKGAFIARGVTQKGGNDSRTGKQVFVRTTRPKVKTKQGRYAGTNIERTPIRKLWGPSLPKEFLDKRMITEMDKLGKRYWPKNFKVAIDFYTKQFK